jgi:RNA polymerase sigma factor (sigma-70 family)
MNDWQLLHDYAANHSEEAFRELVERHSGMVYHTALRQTGNSHAAQEAAQVVFIALAQKAGRIRRQASLHGWLFGATRFAVLNQARKNANRQRHEQEALTMQPTLETHEVDSTWEQITPHLNDALESLPAADRDVVMIRFFGNKSHKEVAEMVGVSEETARKRLSRALEKLREIFARRGVVISSVALGAALAAHGAKAAPLEAASAWAQAALAKAVAGTAAVSGGGLLAFLTGAKALVPVVALVLTAVVLTVYKSRSHQTPPVPQLALSPVAPATNQSAAPAATTKPADVSVPAAALDKVYAALHDTNETTVYPNAVMQEAIAGLADKKKAALPILEKGLTDADAVVRLRAVDGLGIVGSEAGGAAPAILALLRKGGFGEAFPHPSYDTQEA